MAPYYQAYKPGFKLEKDDIDAITYLYGETALFFYPDTWPFILFCEPTNPELLYWSGTS